MENQMAAKQNRKKVRAKYHGGMVEKNSVGGWIADILITIILIAFMFVCVIPLWYSLVASFSDGFTLFRTEGMIWLPVGKWNVEGYKHIFASNEVWRGYGNTLLYMVTATFLGTILNVIGGYAMSRKTRYRNVMILYVMFTMMFSGGMIPTYIVMKGLGLVDSPLAVIIPTCTNAWFMVLTMNGFLSVPESTIEAAQIDGAGHLRIMFQIAFPQTMGISLVVILYALVGQWNNWFQAYLYLNSNAAKLWYPLQLVVDQMIARNANFLQSGNIDYSRYLIPFGLVVVSTVPILIVFPFFQKYIEKGALMGGVKE